MAALWYTHLHVYFLAQNTLVKMVLVLENLIWKASCICYLRFVFWCVRRPYRGGAAPQAPYGLIFAFVFVFACFFLSVFDICWILSECRSSPGSPSRLGMASSANQTICHCTTVDTGHPVDSRQRGHLNDNQVLCQPFFGFCGLTFLASE